MVRFALEMMANIKQEVSSRDRFVEGDVVPRVGEIIDNGIGYSSSRVVAVVHKVLCTEGHRTSVPYVYLSHLGEQENKDFYRGVF